MVGLNTQCNGPLKALITVMAWLVNLMYQRWRYPIVACCIFPVTGSAFCLKVKFADLSVL